MGRRREIKTIIKTEFPPVANKWRVRICFRTLCYFNQTEKIMKRIKLHLRAALLFAPAFFVLSSTIILVLLGAIYFSWLVFRWSSTIKGRKFLRAYYHEILRLENML